MLKSDFDLEAAIVMLKSDFDLEAAIVMLKYLNVRF